MRPLIQTFTVVLTLAVLSVALASEVAATGVIKRPLANGHEVRRPINEKLLLIATPVSGEGWDIKVIKRPAGPDSLNLLYHSCEWHGPYPTQVYAWQVAKEYFPNSRWVCVRGYPVEVHITLDHPTIKKIGKKTVFQGGTLVVAWFNRPCTHGFGGLVHLNGQTFPELKADSAAGLFWPWGRAQNRITNGAEDNVWHYYQIFLQKHGDSPASTSATPPAQKSPGGGACAVGPNYSSRRR